MVKVDEKKEENLSQSKVPWNLNRVVHRIVEPVQPHEKSTLAMDEQIFWQKRLKIIEFLPTKSDKPSRGYSNYIAARLLAIKREEFATKWGAFNIEETESSTSYNSTRRIPFLDDQDQMNNLENVSVYGNTRCDQIQRDLSIVPEVITLDDTSETIKASGSTSSSASSVSLSVNSGSDATTNEPERFSPTKEIEGDKIRDDVVQEAKKNVVEDIKIVEELAPPPKSKTPELLDEGVGGKSHFFVKIPRKAISLNLQALEAQCIKGNRKRSTICTEISVADSSVSDHENPTSYSLSGESDRRKDDVKSKKLKIVEDVTCLEGTILADRALLNSSTMIINRNEEMQTEIALEIEEERHASVVSTCIRSKREARVITCIRKKLRIRRRFRQLFGKDLTSSELDEEDDIIDRFLGISRRKKTRNSSDSGVGLTDLTSGHTSFSESDSEQQDSSEEQAQSSPEVITISDLHEEKKKPKALLRSMPSLDSLPSTSDIKEEIIAEAVPDSTNSSEDSVVQADSCVHEPTNHKGKLTILVTPVNANSPDTFSPVRLEIDMSCNNQTSTPTSTTEHFSQISSVQNTEEGENTKENNDSESHVKIDITRDGEYKVVLSPRHAKNEAILIDCSGNTASNAANQNGVTVMIAQDFSSQGNEKISLYQGFEDITPVSSPGVTTNGSEKSKNNTQEQKNDEGNSNNEAPMQPETLPPVTSSSPSLPRLRVLLPSELGSRWCPTPLTNITSSSQNIMSVSSGIPRATPILSNYLSQSNAFVANVQPAQSIPNVPNMPGRSSEDIIPRTHATSYKNLPNNINCSQQGCSGPNSVPQDQPSLTRNDIPTTLNSIFQLLESLNLCVELHKTAYHPDSAKSLQNQFIADKVVLYQKIEKLSSDVRIYDYHQLIESIMDYFEQWFPCRGKNLNRSKIWELLRLKSLPDARLEPQVNVETQVHYDHVVSQPQIRPPPPPYQAFPSTSYVPQTSGSSASSYIPLPRVMLFNHNQHTPCGIPQTLPYANPYPFNVRQLNTLHYQILTYYRLYNLTLELLKTAHRVQSQRKPTKTKRPRTEKNTTLQTRPSPIESVPQLSTTLDSVPWNSPAVQNNLDPVPTEPSSQPSNIVRSEKTINDSDNNEAALTQERYNKTIDDVLRNITRTVEKISESSNNETIAKEARNHYESVDEVLRTMALITQPTIDCSNTDDNNNNNDQGTETRTLGSSPIPEKASIAEAMEETETMSSVEQETPDVNENEENDEFESPSSCEPVLVIDEPEIVETEVEITKSNSVEDSNKDSELENTEMKKCDEIESSFSILEVKSITKDIFDNMGTIEEESADPTFPEASRDVKEDYDDSTTNSELRNCLRCGEQSSVVCEQCYEAFYCSSECHEAHWTEHHYLTCKPVPAEALAKF